MNIDTEHLHHWMCAIRESNNPMRTLDAFWQGQMKSKEWLIDELSKHITGPVTIDIHCGWVGTLASMLFQSGLDIGCIQSIDIDPLCQHVAINMNKMEHFSGKFRAIVKDICDFHSYADIIINTSCEHISQEEYDTWLSNLPIERLIVLQSTNYPIDEHRRNANSLNEFVEQSKIKNILFKGELELIKYNRYMIIGTT